METPLGLMIGIGLSAACGFRVFVPLLGLSIASMSGQVTVSGGFEWIGSWPALVAFTTATIVEIAAYYIPWVDNLMDTITTPAAIIAGTMMTAAMVHDMSPFLKWSLALIAGGGTAGIIQGGTVLLRGASLTTTGGLGNLVVAKIELMGALVITVLTIFIPVIALIVIACAGYKLFSYARRRTGTVKNQSAPL